MEFCLKYFLLSKDCFKSVYVRNIVNFKFPKREEKELRDKLLNDEDICRNCKRESRAHVG